MQWNVSVNGAEPSEMEILREMYPSGGFGESGPELDLTPLIPPPDDEHFLAALSEPVNGAALRDYIHEVGGFNKAHGRWQVLRRAAGSAADSAWRTIQHIRGHDEDVIDVTPNKDPASYGVIELLGEKAVFFATNYDSRVGVVGVETGRKYEAAAQLAIERKLPFVVDPPSAGMDVKDGASSVYQISFMTDVDREFKERSDRPLIKIVGGKVLGGMAPMIPHADFVIGLKGSTYGFAGDKVRDAFDNTTDSDGVFDTAPQSVEANLVNRNLNVVASSPDELIEYVAHAIRVTRPTKRKSKPTQNAATQDPPELREFELYGNGLVPLYSKNRKAVRSGEAKNTPFSGLETPHDKYQNAIEGTNRVDTQFVLEEAFDEYLPLWTNYERDGKIVSPHIIAGIGTYRKEGETERRIMIIGNNPNYEVYDNGHVRKILSTPGPDDAEYVARMLKLAEDYKMPVLYLCDTPGADPSVKNENAGLNRQFSNEYMAAASLKVESAALATGIMGSGGGKLTWPGANVKGMTEDATVHTAEPQATAAIAVPSGQKLTQQDVIDTANNSESTAEKMLDAGLSAFTVPLGDTPHETAVNIVDAAIVELDKVRENTKRGQPMVSHRSKVTRKHLAIRAEEVAA